MADVAVVQVALEPDRTVVRVVLLDAQQRRVVPLGRELRYEVHLQRTYRGSLKLTPASHRDGIFELILPAEKRPTPCELHVFAKFHNGQELLEDWVDDWMYRC